MIALLLMLGCGSAPPVVLGAPLAAPELAQIDAVVQAWNERQDIPPLDTARLRTLRVIDPPTRAEYLELCGGGLGCTHGRNRCSWPGCARDIFVVVSPGLSPGSRLSAIRHEAVHFARDIAGLGPDATHLDRRVWGYHCGAQDTACRAGIVEERARAIANGAP